MRDLLHFTKHLLLWNIKSFVIISSTSLILLVSTKWFPEIDENFFLFNFLLIIIYFIYSFNAFVDLADGTSAIIGNSFSEKYLQALPFSKKKLILILLVSNSYTIIPVLISIIGLTLKQKEKFALLLIPHNLFLLIIFILFFYTIFVFCLISYMFEKSRGDYNRQNISNTLLVIKDTFRVLVKITIFILSFVYIFIEKPIFSVTISIAIMAIYCILSFTRCHSLAINDNVYYWNRKRDIYSTGAYLLTLIILGFSIYLLSIKPWISKKTDEIYKNHSTEVLNSYSKGPQIFSDVLYRKWKNISKYLREGKDLSLVNEDGVGLIHLLALLVNYDEVGLLKEGLLKNPKLLGKRLKPTDEKSCSSIFYIEDLTPIHILSSMNKAKILTRALKKFPSGLELKTKTEETPLHYAAKFCAYKTTADLIRKGANVNAISMEGNSPLMLASKNKCLVVTALLIRSGANLNLKNEQGLTASKISKENKHKKIHFLLENFSKGP